MFDREYSFKGKHAKMVTELTGKFTINGEERHCFFERNFDVYLLAPIIGFLYHRKSSIDKTPDINPTKIFGDTIMNNANDLKFNYRLIMLLDKENESDKEKKVEKAFCDINNPEDEELYESYVRGGVEVLHEKLIEDIHTPDDYINHLYEFLEEFSSRYNDDSDDSDIQKVLERCAKVKT